MTGVHICSFSDPQDYRIQGEPPPKCTKCGGNLVALPTVHCPKCASTNFLTGAARPSEPSAPQTSAEPPQEKQEMRTERDLWLAPGRNPAAPQPVSGDVIAREIFNAPALGIAFDSERIEAIAKILRKHGVGSPAYFPPASQTPNTLDFHNWLTRVHGFKVGSARNSYKEADLEAAWNAGTSHRPEVIGAKPLCLDCHGAGIINCSHFDNCSGKWVYVATPASTARKWTDALGDYRNDLARDLTCQEGAAFKAGFLAAAPGSVPQAPESPKKPHCPNCGCNHFRGENTLCNDGAPQAEPPKEEK